MQYVILNWKKNMFVLCFKEHYWDSVWYLNKGFRLDSIIVSMLFFLDFIIVLCFGFKRMISCYNKPEIQDSTETRTVDKIQLNLTKPSREITRGSDKINVWRTPRLVCDKHKENIIHHGYLLSLPQQVSVIILPSLSLSKHLLNHMAFPSLFQVKANATVPLWNWYKPKGKVYKSYSRVEVCTYLTLLWYFYERECSCFRKHIL